MVSFVPAVGVSSYLVLGFSALHWKIRHHLNFIPCAQPKDFALSQDEGQKRNEEVCVSYVDQKDVPWPPKGFGTIHRQEEWGNQQFVSVNPPSPSVNQWSRSLSFPLIIRAGRFFLSWTLRDTIDGTGDGAVAGDRTRQVCWAQGADKSEKWTFGTAGASPLGVL